MDANTNPAPALDDLIRAYARDETFIATFIIDEMAADKIILVNYSHKRVMRMEIEPSALTFVSHNDCGDFNIYTLEW